MNCRSGKADAEGVIETRGTGRDLLANLRSQGVFSAQGLELGLTPSVKSVSGTYRLAWAKPEPRLSFQELELEISDEVYTGRGATQEDGRLLIELASPTRELRVSGTLAKLRVEEPAPARRHRPPLKPVELLQHDSSKIVRSRQPSGRPL